MNLPEPAAASARAHADLDSVVALTQDLVRIPTRGGIDPYDAAIDHLMGWMDDHGLAPQVLRDASDTAVAVAARVQGRQPGRTWVLDACLDTAPFGDEDAWHHPPTSAVLEDGWLWGRGAADSKVAVAIFCHLAARLLQQPQTLRGEVVVLFDLDEHTGGFAGARRYFDSPDTPADIGGVMIGYPGMNHIVIGGRGVHRARLHVHGVASHSGASRPTPSAIAKAAEIVTALNLAPLPGPADGFAAGKLTVTAIDGGQGFSTVPDLCTLSVDARTTPAFDDAHAAQTIADVVAKVDTDWPETPPTLVEAHTRWPPYALNHDAPLRTALTTAAAHHGFDPAAKIAGPSNIGNYLARLGIPATAGFGPHYEGLHATNERVRIDTIPIVQAIYDRALQLLTQS
ncbi:succinyl-diaminopimelate desuccinylase [Lipingzhangella halophila]|uniref:Succinyl-diaminopimelate desuccinylase n=1 Tax=Lipingzhangella halophila TaxID=1783352 RepID=A0A7W7RNN7_9ACTN|nr:M20/M25/M40 family metallo-hydrolase [Lipingzhangella halophila]MBB4934838.1 succinyl-diaminopimelate desuccinylase [Lipingzhangella halophila]